MLSSSPVMHGLIMRFSIFKTIETFVRNQYLFDLVVDTAYMAYNLYLYNVAYTFDDVQSLFMTPIDGAIEAMYLNYVAVYAYALLGNVKLSKSIVVHHIVMLLIVGFCYATHLHKMFIIGHGVASASTPLLDLSKYLHSVKSPYARPAFALFAVCFAYCRIYLFARHLYARIVWTSLQVIDLRHALDFYVYVLGTTLGSVLFALQIMWMLKTVKILLKN